MPTTAAKPKSLHESALVVDSLMVCNWSPQILRNIHSGGVTAVSATCAVWENFRETMDNIAEWYQWFDRHSDLIMPVRCTADILEAKRTSRLGIILIFQNGAPLEDRFEFVRTFKRLGVGSIQITYNNQNFIGSGCYESNDTGLSDFGRMVIDEMNAVGIAVDLSHVGPKTTADAIAYSKKPVCFSHANPKALKDHARNKDDDLIKALAKRGGYVGVNLFPMFMPDQVRDRLEGLIVMLDHLINLIGEDQVGVGTDMTEGYGPDFWRWITLVNGRGTTTLNVPLSEQRQVLAKTSDYHLITRTLEQAGYKESRIRKILGLNYIDFLKKAWNES